MHVDWSRLFAGVPDPAAAERSIEVNKPCHIARKILAVPTVRLNTQNIRNAGLPPGLTNIKCILSPLLWNIGYRGLACCRALLEGR
jgi:hypothetical protein